MTTTYIFAGTPDEATLVALERELSGWRYITEPDDLPIPTNGSDG